MRWACWMDAWVSMVSWGCCQSPVAHSCGLLNHLNSFCEVLFKLHAKFDVDPLLYSLSYFNVMATQYTCTLNGVYSPHRLVQWSHQYSPCTFQSTLLACQVRSTLYILFCYINSGWPFSRQTSYIYNFPSSMWLFTFSLSIWPVYIYYYQYVCLIWNFHFVPSLCFFLSICLPSFKLIIFCNSIVFSLLVMKVISIILVIA